MEATGGIVLQEQLDLLQAELENFFGQQAEIRVGLKPEEPLLSKPPELIRYEIVKKIGLPVWDGGMMDQPHLWLGQFGVVDNVYQLFAAIERRQQQAEEEAKKKDKNGANTER